MPAKRKELRSPKKVEDQTISKFSLDKMEQTDSTEGETWQDFKLRVFNDFEADWISFQGHLQDCWVASRETSKGIAPYILLYAFCMFTLMALYAQIDHYESLCVESPPMVGLNELLNGAPRVAEWVRKTFYRIEKEEHAECHWWTHLTQNYRPHVKFLHDVGRKIAAFEDWKEIEGVLLFPIAWVWVRQYLKARKARLSEMEEEKEEEEILE